MAAGDGESWHDAKPVRRQPQKSLRNGNASATARDDARYDAPASLGTVDEKILHLEEILEDRITAQKAAGKRVTRAKGAWLEHRDKTVLLARSRAERTSEDVRDTLARTERNDEGVLGHKLWFELEDAEQDEKSMQSEVKAIQARLSALQSVGNHIFRAT